MTNDMPEQSPPRPVATRRIPLAVGAVLVGAVIGFAGIYGFGGLKRSVAGDSPCSGAVELSRKLAPLVHGEVAALTMATAPLQLPDLAFEDADGKPRKLSEWRGRTVLVNLWATWCVPCRAEMPALDRLQAKLGGADFEVVAVNIDTSRLDRPKAFLDEAGVKSLNRYADSSADSFEALKVAGKALGLPTSLLIGPDGCELAVMAGPAQWDSEDAAKVVTAMVGK
jgi:thiol-disulfide isomerase/thioredoxin